MFVLDQDNLIYSEWVGQVRNSGDVINIYATSNAIESGTVGFISKSRLEKNKKQKRWFTVLTLIVFVSSSIS